MRKTWRVHKNKKEEPYGDQGISKTAGRIYSQRG